MNDPGLTPHSINNSSTPQASIVLLAGALLVALIALSSHYVPVAVCIEPFNGARPRDLRERANEKERQKRARERELYIYIEMQHEREEEMQIMQTMNATFT